MTNPQLENYDPQVLMELQATFGHLVMGNPRLEKLINGTAPILFATLLFTAAQAYRESDDGESVEPTVGVLEALDAAQGYLQSVATAFGVLSGEITIEPTDSEVDADTDVVGI